MFELFGSDSDKKEEIDKNMDKIKDMVGSSSNTDRPSQTRSSGQAQQPDQTGQGASLRADEDTSTASPAPVQAEGRQPPQGPSSPKDSSPGTQEPSSGPQQLQEGQKSPQDRSKDRKDPIAPKQGTSGPQQEENQPSQNRNSAAPTRPQKTSGQQDTGPSRQDEPAGGVSQEPTPDDQPEPEPDADESEPEPPQRHDIPEAPQTREIEVPEIEKGPLFIRVKKFKEAKKMIHEMQDLADDVETDMGGLQNTLEEDKDVQKDLKGRLKKLRDSMKSIHTIVSP